ncbi:hypothetical protein LZ30DRAFT_607965, partial [Colletotrichum cereale]
NAPAYEQLSGDEQNVDATSQYSRSVTNTSVVTKLGFFVLGSLVAMGMSAAIIFCVPHDMYVSLYCSESG